MTDREWLQAYAAALDVPAPTDAEMDVLLRLAGVAAHASARTAAPVACWLAARAGRSPEDALRLASEVAPAP